MTFLRTITFLRNKIENDWLVKQGSLPQAVLSIEAKISDLMLSRKSKKFQETVQSQNGTSGNIFIPPTAISKHCQSVIEK